MRFKRVNGTICWLHRARWIDILMQILFFVSVRFFLCCKHYMQLFSKIVDFQCNFVFNTSFWNLLRYKWINFDRQFPETFHWIELNWNALIPLNLNETFKSAFVLCDGHSGGFETFSVNKSQSHVKTWIKKYILDSNPK